MRIRWTPVAAADLEHISDYLKEHHPHLPAAHLAQAVRGCRSLKHWPQLGRPGREEGTRELLFPPLPYVAVYRVEEQTIEVLRIYHGAQDRP